MRGGVVRHGLGGGIGQLVGRTHHKGVEGVLVDGEAGLLPGSGGLFHLVVVQDADLKVLGEEVEEGRLDVVQEEGLDIALLKAVSAVEHQDAALNLHGFGFIEPGGDGGLGQFLAQLLKDRFPDIRD